ncbi:MAG TPA: AzlC family ABC transporter permease [Candidatus Limnocylindrales bacterium]|nr:AzlC family ABC transporter permease [Candidatus Limnocylindrales bacterium]
MADAGVEAGAAADAHPSGGIRAARRQTILDGIGIIVTAAGFGFVYGLAAREDAGFSPVEVVAMSTLVFAGAAQFAAVGYIAAGLAWPGVVILTALLNARHILYSASIAPWFAGRSLPLRAIAAHLLTDEAYALSMAHFRRTGRADLWGYWFAAIAVTFIPWNLATLAGVVVGGSIPEPEQFGIDVIFPAAMLGLAVGLITGRREIVAAVVGAGVGVGVSLALGTAVGIIAGGVIGPAVGMLVPERIAREEAPLGSTPSAERYSMPGTRLGRTRRPDDAMPEPPDSSSEAPEP